MSLLILTLPLLGSLSSGLLGYKIGKQGSIIITTILLFITMLLGIILFINICYTQSIYHIKLFTWLNFDSFDISWGFNFDSLTVAMLLPVLIISFLVHLYSISYMENDPHISRFFAYLSMFTFFMLILITADNFLLMFVGWEGVGISSYLLVNFWFTRIQANKSAISALLTNRVGDMLLTIGLFIILSSFGNLNYHVIFPLVPYIHSTIITIIGIFLLLGAMAKSAQLGLHIWLPQAMEGFKRALLKFHYTREYLKIYRSTHSIVKNIYIRQPAGNFIRFFNDIKSKNNYKSSSETTREISNIVFNKPIDDKFKFWFIGFLEGDGSFIINNNITLEFKVTQSSIDVQILYYIQKELGFGSVKVQDPKQNTHPFRVRNEQGFFQLINIINGNLLTTARKNKFKLWLECYNKRY